MDDQSESNQHGTLDTIAENLKSGVASAPEPVFSDETKKAANLTAARAGDVANDVADLASAASDTARNGANDIGRAASAVRSKVVAGAKDIAVGTTAEVSHFSSDVGGAASDSLARIRGNVVNNPIKAILLAAGLGYLAALVTR